MSLFGKLETYVEIKASAEKFHEMFKSKPHHITHSSPHNVQGCELHEGEWGTVGSIIFWNYVHDGKTCIAKEVVEAIDEANYSVTFKVIEGNLLDDYKTCNFILQVTPKEEGSVVHWTFEYEKQLDVVVDSHSMVLFLIDLSKDLGQYLVSQP